MSYASEFIHNYDLSFFKYTEPKSSDYKVFVNGEEASVYTCRISEYAFNTVWPGHQRPFNQTVGASFVNLVSEEKLHIKVIAAKKYKKAMLKPYSKEIAFTENNGVIEFDINPGDNLVLQLDDHRGCLYLFCSKPVVCENPSNVTYYFGPGIHFPGKITLKSGESIYADKDALIFGCVYAENAENIRIYGNGVFDDSHEERTANYCYENYVNGNFKLYDCKNVHLEGVLFKNSAIWCINLFGCTDVTANNVKVFGQWRYNTDGIDIVNCRDIMIKNSFIHSFDDTITIKGIDRYDHIDNERITIDNCVLWCDWGKCCEVGIETACRFYRDITFRNCDVLRAGNAALDIANGDYAEIQNVLFENIRVEYNAFDTPEQYQHTDDEVYTRQNEISTPCLIMIRNKNFRSKEHIELWGLPPVPDDVNLDGVNSASVHHVTVRNIKVYHDKDIPKRDGKYNAPIIIQNFYEEASFHNFVFEDIYINGEKLTKETAVLEGADTVKDSHILD